VFTSGRALFTYVQGQCYYYAKFAAGCLSPDGQPFRFKQI
jgi:hypothetical protein